MDNQASHHDNQVGKALLDVVHIAVGFSVIAFQKAQVARRELEAEWQRRFPKPKP